jgi:hypothetical protein
MVCLLAAHRSNPMSTRFLLAPITMSALIAAAGCGGSAVSDGGTVLQCDPACPKGQHCTLGGCVPDNPGGSADFAMSLDGSVGGGCDPKCGGATPICNASGHCVACAVDKDCPGGTICRILGPASSACVPGCTDDSRCTADGGAGYLKCCGGMCVDARSDGQNCGSCGTPCSGNHSTSMCKDGVCNQGACTAGWGDCNNDPKDGCETSLRVDPNNCTGCGMQCMIANAIAGCSDGCYMRGCQFGFDDCNGDSKDGCEKSITSDVANCGGCGMSCGNVFNGRPACQNGVCVITSCTNGFADCDGQFKNGCEVAITNDPKNCGGCMKACAQNNICVGGQCTCPQCNNIFPNASAKCVNNQCVFDQCNLGFGDCDFNINNGCEADLTSDASNCGACGNVCPNNTPICINSKCSAIDLAGVYNQYASEGRNVYIWKTAQCQDLTKATDFCTRRGLAWWSPKSQADAQLLVTTTANYINQPLWVQVYGLKTDMGASTLGGYNVKVDSPGCVASCDGTGFGAFRRWGCSFCDPKQNQNQSCCWDKGNGNDWFACED